MSKVKVDVIRGVITVRLYALIDNCVAIDLLHAVDQLIPPEEKGKPPPSVYFEINSGGGDIMAAMAIYDRFRTLHSARLIGSITSVGTGMIASAALVLMTGLGRFGRTAITRHSVVCVHRAQHNSSGNSRDVTASIETIERVWSELLETVFTGVVADGKKMLKTTTEEWITSHEAVRLRFAEIII